LPGFGALIEKLCWQCGQLILWFMVGSGEFYLATITERNVTR